MILIRGYYKSSFKLGLDLFSSVTAVSWEVENLIIKICTKSISYSHMQGVPKAKFELS